MPDPTSDPPEGARILVAEDEAHIRRVLEALFESRSFAVDFAENGTDALERLAGKDAYDLVILDLMMPGASGLQVLSGLRRLDHRRDVPVVILTAKGQDTDREEAMALGADDFITKPFSPKRLLGRIDELLAI